MTTAEYERLTKEKRKIPDKFELLRARVHRAISWGRRAERDSEDIDARFIFFWIGINSLYSKKSEIIPKKSKTGDSQQIFTDALTELRGYLDVLVPLNSTLIHKTFWSGKVFQAGVALMDDEYLYKSFWQTRPDSIKGNKGYEGLKVGKSRFVQAQFLSEMQRKQIPEILATTIFGRLSVLRNQVMHGSATHNSMHNRKALRRGVTVLEKALPVFINLMIENQHNKGWGEPPYLPR